MKDTKSTKESENEALDEATTRFETEIRKSWANAIHGLRTVKDEEKLQDADSTKMKNRRKYGAAGAIVVTAGGGPYIYRLF